MKVSPARTRTVLIGGPTGAIPLDMATRPSQSRTQKVDHTLRDGWLLAALQSAGVLTKEQADGLRADGPEWVSGEVITRGPRVPFS